LKSAKTRAFETPATVAYFHPKRGMGLAFKGMEPQFASLLKKWLSRLKAAVRRISIASGGRAEAIFQHVIFPLQLDFACQICEHFNLQVQTALT
jgi:hypothetical protein